MSYIGRVRFEVAPKPPKQGKYFEHFQALNQPNKEKGDIPMQNEETEITNVANEDGPVPKTDMAKVNYFLSRPALLVNQLPKTRKAELSEHVGRRASTGPRGLANPRLNTRR